jgi:hypothetical protein
MRWINFAFCGALAAALCLSAEAAQPDAAASPGDDTITFELYREWRLYFEERRRSELAVQLSATNLPERQKTRLEETRAYYDWLAALPETDRDRRFRERFDRIDANHDGKIDTAERAAWRDKQRAFYNRGKTAREPRETAEAR